MAQTTHEQDRYPIFLFSDLWTFLCHESAIGAWVAVVDDEVVGHVALHRDSMPGVIALASETLGLAADQLGVVARLMVAPEVRRQGIAQSLLAHVTQEAINRGLWPVLDVVTVHTAAIAMYDALGWRRAGVVTSQLAEGSFDEIVYLAPEGP
jgi:GNAT superfamily N-acetyltransferase